MPQVIRTFVCADCADVKHGRSYGGKKYGVTLCFPCFVRRVDAEDRDRATWRRLRDTARKKGLSFPTWAQHSPTQATKYLRAGGQRVGGWHDPDVQAHHADMLRKYFGARSDGE